MADTPELRSYTSCLNDIREGFLSKQGVPTLRAGNPLLSLFEAAARGDLRSSQDVFGYLSSASLDNASGVALARIGADENVPRQQQLVASGTVTVSDASFTRLATKLFSGSPAPIAGSATIDVADAAAWPASGSFYVGRGTPNYEGPLAYTAKTNNSTHWTLTLANPTVKFHNVSEAAVLAQGGNRSVRAGTIVRTPQANVADAVEFKTLYPATLPDGETSIAGVFVQAQKPGTIGNVSADAIREFASAPFTGAAVTNPLPYSSGLETETEDQWRERIRAKRRSRSLGTRLAIKTAVTGIVAADENKRVTSAEVVSRIGAPSVVYVDDGTGYEERSAGAALETLTDSAVGGEQYFSLTRRPVAKAFAPALNVAPYSIPADSSLVVRTGAVTQIHFFNAADFLSASAATAFEVTASINANPELAFQARTSDGGTRVVLFAKAEENDDLEVLPGGDPATDASTVLGFATHPYLTLQLYRNDRLLTKDGVSASVVSEPFPNWETPASPATLVVAVDGTDAITITFTAQDFIDASTGFAVVGRNSTAAWAAVLDRRVPGIAATVDAGRLVITSNAGPSAKARVEIVGGSLVAAHFFVEQSVSGQPRDYVLDRSTGEVRLEVPLASGDRLTAGSAATRAFVQSRPLPTPSVVASDASLWLSVDGGAKLVPQGVTSASSLVVAPSALRSWGHELRITAGAGTFANARAGDHLVLSDVALPASLRGVLRVAATNADTYLEVDRCSAVTRRAGHASVALPPVGSAISRVFTTGGYLRSIVNPTVSTPSGATTACEIFDPNTNVTSVAAPMSVARSYHTASVAGNGSVVVVGGFGADGASLDSIERYDPGAGTWSTSARTLTSGMAHHRAVTLGDGTILICGGSRAGTATNRAYVYDAAADTLTAVGNMGTARWSHGLVVLPTGEAMVAGGYTAFGTRTTSAERYNAGAHTWSAAAALPAARADFGLAVAGTTQVLAVGSSVGQSDAATRHVYTIGSDTWGSSASLPSSHVFEDKSAVTLHSGDVAILHTHAGTTKGACRYNTGSGLSLVAGDALMAETATKYEPQYVLLSKADASYLNHVVAVGGLATLTVIGAYEPIAGYELWDGNANTWSVPDPASGTFTPLDEGLALVRASGALQTVVVPASANYTARSVANILNAAMTGATASTYRTTRLRVTTNTFGESGNVALVAHDAFADSLQLDAGDSIANLTAHAGSVEAGHPDLGTPSFQSVRVLGNQKPSGGVSETLLVTPGTVDTGAAWVGLRDWDSLADGSVAVSPTSIGPRYGANVDTRSRLRAVTNLTWASQVDLRTHAQRGWAPLDRGYWASPYGFSTEDTLTVAVDNDPSQRFQIALARRLTTVGSTYSQTNVFRDTNGASLAATFGLNFSFDDFAIVAHARALAYPTTSRALLFRYYRDGRDGETARVRFANPERPSAPFTCGVDVDHGATTDVRLQLLGGAPRAVTVRPTTSVGYACTTIDGGGIGTLVFVLNLPAAGAARTTNVTTLTLTLPSGITNHGLAVSNVVWVTSNSGSFTAGAKTVTARTNTTISYAETAADATASNIGTVSLDSIGEATTTGSGTAAGDFWRLDGGTFGVFAGSTFHTTSVAAGNVFATSGEATGLGTSVMLTWGSLGSATLALFANPAQTAAQVRTAIAGLQAAGKCPVTATLLGSGAGLIDRSTPDDLDSASAWYQLADGYNYVASTTSPGSIAGDYSLTLKNPVTGALSTSSDWANEPVWLVPTTTANVVSWLNAPTVSGLFVDAEVRASSAGTKPQIATRTLGSSGGVQVQGGLANNVALPVVGNQRTSAGPNSRTISTVRRSTADGLRSGSWCAVQNTEGLPRPGVFTITTNLVSWGVDGTIVVDTPLYVERLARVDTKLQFEHQGDFVAVSNFGSNINLSTVAAGDHLRVVPPAAPSGFQVVSPGNQGIFRVARVDVPADASAGTVWIENSNATPEVSEASFAIYTSGSTMPGDVLVIATPLWGASNQGRWSVESVGSLGGDQFSSTTTMRVRTDERLPVAQPSGPDLGASASLVQVVEGTPARFILQLQGTAPNQDDGNFIDLRWDQAVTASAISAAAGSTISVLDKLGFPLTFAAGRDGYAYNTGLIGEANRVIQGDPGDPATYPGVAAEGSRIVASGPLVRRIRVALSIRTRTRVAREDVATRVRNAVASAVNRTPMGTPIALSSIVTAAGSVAGVAAVAVISPVYGAASDVLAVQPNEKPLVLNLDQDIQIFFVGD